MTEALTGDMAGSVAPPILARQSSFTQPAPVGGGRNCGHVRCFIVRAKTSRDFGFFSLLAVVLRGRSPVDHGATKAAGERAKPDLT